MAKFLITDKVIEYYTLEIEAETKEEAERKFLECDYNEEDRVFMDSELKGYDIEEIEED